MKVKITEIRDCPTSCIERAREKIIASKKDRYEELLEEFRDELTNRKDSTGDLVFTADQIPPIVERLKVIYKEAQESLVVEEYIPEVKEGITHYKDGNGAEHEVSKKESGYCIYIKHAGMYEPEAFIITEEEFNEYTKEWELIDEKV